MWWLPYRAKVGEPINDVEKQSDRNSTANISRKESSSDIKSATGNQAMQATIRGKRPERGIATAALQSEGDGSGGEAKPAALPTSTTATASLDAGVAPHPTGIEKTEVVAPRLHFGAQYGHTLKSSGGDLEGLLAAEEVKTVKDDFKTGLPDVKLGEITARIKKGNLLLDKIWISFGAIAPSIKRLREKRKPGESLLGEQVSHQELYYDARKPGAPDPDWKKFTDVEIRRQLYDLPGLTMLTIDNKKDAAPEEFTPFPSKQEKDKP